MDKYEQFCERKQREYGETFDPSSLAPEFVPYFNSGQRVRIRFSYGEEMTGTIGVTMGWCPVFLLMLRSNDHGSSWTLKDTDEIVAVQFGRTYVPIENLYTRPVTS
jgi:hypothetical protein